MDQVEKKLPAGQRRFVPKRRDRTWWVYDTARASWPRTMAKVGIVRTDFRTEEAAQTEADRLEEAIG